MKQLFYILILLSVLSCKKKHPDPEITSTSGSIQYKMNGDLVKMDNINLLNGEGVGFEKELQGITLPATRYLLTAQKEPDHFLSLTLVTDTLEEASYHYDSASVNNNFSEFTFDLDNRGQFMSLYFATDRVDIHISSNKNSRVSGTFTARFSIVTGSLADYKSRGSIYITEGVFNNVPVTY